MSQVRITDKRLVPQIKEYLEQSVGNLVTDSDVLNYIVQRYPELVIYFAYNTIDIAAKTKLCLQRKSAVLYPLLEIILQQNQNHHHQFR